VTTVLVRILFPMTGLMVVSAWCLGILNTHRRFFLPLRRPRCGMSRYRRDDRGGRLADGEGLKPMSSSTGWHSPWRWGTVVGSVLQIAVQLPTCWRLAARHPSP